MVITIKMAFISTLIGFIISVPLASLSANNLVPLPVAIPARVLLAGLESSQHNLGTPVCNCFRFWTVARNFGDDPLHNWLSRKVTI